MSIGIDENIRSFRNIRFNTFSCKPTPVTPTPVTPHKTHKLITLTTKCLYIKQVLQ